MKPLPLAGRLGDVSGFSKSTARTVVRLADPAMTPRCEADAALVRSADDCSMARLAGFHAVVATTENIPELASFPAVARVGPAFQWLSSGDLIAIEPKSRRYRVLWRRFARHNAFLVTERCDHLCLMCSQPPKDIDDGWIIDEIRYCLSLLPPDTATIGFTGGEPFLSWKRFVELAEIVQERLAAANLHVLTNGRAFANTEVVRAWSRLDKDRACVGIPIYSAVDAIHDHIVQSCNALNETVLGILRLKDKGNRVEVRVVLHRLTVERLAQTCDWLARNLPFVDHVALMGMEDTGFALANQGILWMDPVDYGDTLARAVSILLASGLKVSIYNLPLCVLPSTVRPFAVRSISDWKNAHPAICAPCEERERCAGFFTTGRPMLSRAIAPIVDR